MTPQLVALMLRCPLVGFNAATHGVDRIAHRIDIDGFNAAPTGEVTGLTARCGTSVKAAGDIADGAVLRWKSLRTRGTGIRRCAACNGRPRPIKDTP